MNQPVRHQAESLSIQQVLTFCRVYEHGGYASASDDLGLAGPTMWEQVKVLESIYRTTLFERKGRSIQPTAQGDLLYTLLSPLLATVESTFELLSEQDQSGPKQIRLVTGVRMMLEELGEPLRKFLSEFADHRLKLMTADNRVAQELVLSDKADMALLIEPPREAVMQGIACEVLYPIDYLAAFPPRHRLARKADFTLLDLEHEPIVAGNPDTVGRRMLEQAWFRYSIKSPMNIVVETDNSAFTIACVRAGIGIGVIAGRMDGNLSKHVASKLLSRDLGRVNVVAATKIGRKPTKALSALLQLLHQTKRGIDA
ncbi:MAG: LysR family transcriptional regulator [Pirellula sp.]